MELSEEIIESASRPLVKMLEGLGAECFEILAKVKDKIVGVRYENQIGIAFHPEVTKDNRIHKYFLELCESNRPDTARNMELSHSSSSGNLFYQQENKGLLFTKRFVSLRM